MLALEFHDSLTLQNDAVMRSESGLFNLRGAGIHCYVWLEWSVVLTEASQIYRTILSAYRPSLIRRLVLLSHEASYNPLTFVRPLFVLGKTTLRQHARLNLP